MKKNISIVVLVFLLKLSEICSAQEFVKGCIFTIEGDTLKGQIQYQSANSISKCVFRANEQATTTNYTAPNIKGFEMGEKKFMSIKTNNSVAFYMVLASGKMNLLFQKDSYFIWFKDSLVTLEEKRKIESATNTTYADAYKPQLTVLMNECNNGLTIANKASFTSKSLSNAVDEFNKCVGTTNSYLYKPIQVKGNWQVKLGISFATCDYTNLLNQYVKTDGSAFFGSLNYQTIASWLDKNFSLSAGIEYRKYNFSKFNFNPSYLGFPFMGIYEFGNIKNTIRPFAEAGFQFNLFTGKADTPNQAVPSILNKQSIAFPFGIGMKMKTGKGHLLLGLKYGRFINAFSNRIISKDVFIGYTF